MQLLGFLTSRRHIAQGFTLVELLVCLVLLSAIASLASANWQRLQEKNRIESTRDQLMNDLQTARILALQHGETLQLLGLRNCTWANNTNTDWSCGWQLVVKADQSLIYTNALVNPVQVSFGKATPFEISGRGDLGTVGDRWLIKSKQSTLNIANVLCLNSASRLRWQSGETCS